MTTAASLSFHKYVDGNGAINLLRRPCTVKKLRQMRKDKNSTFLYLFRPKLFKNSFVNNKLYAIFSKENVT
jgi:hypothetical protein